MTPMGDRAPDPGGEPGARADQFHQLFDGSVVPTALISVDTAGIGTIVGANDALGVLLGYPSLAGRTLTELTDERDRPADEPNRARLAAGATDLFRREKHYVRQDGTVLLLQTYATVIGRPSRETLCITVFLDEGQVASVQGQFSGMARFAEALAELRSALLREEPTQFVLELICSWARQILDANHASLMEVVEPGMLRIRAVDGSAPDDVVGLTWPVSHAQFGEALDSRLATRYQVGQDELIGLADRFPGVGRPAQQLFLAMAPVLTADRTLGALTASRARAPFDDEELALLQLFASEVSEALTVAQLRTDLARLAVIEDRERIARNLHDEIIQDLIGVRLGLVHILQRTPDNGACDELADSLAQLDLLTTRVRDVVVGLEAGGGLADFRDTLESITSSKAQGAHIGWTFEIDGELERLADDERVEIVRVLNEAVSNVVRHSDATQVAVALAISCESAQLDIEDDGIGFDADAHAPGMGLRNLRVRAVERGGTFAISTSPDAGTHLRWSIPLRNRA